MASNVRDGEMVKRVMPHNKATGNVCLTQTDLDKIINGEVDSIKVLNQKTNRLVATIEDPVKALDETELMFKTDDHGRRTSFYLMSYNNSKNRSGLK